MNTKGCLALAILAIALGSTNICAEAPGQPGQVAPGEIAVTAATDTNQPILLSPTGETSVNSFLPAAGYARKPWRDPDHRGVVTWKVSLAALLGASAFDAFSSMGKRESNPLLRSSDGTFGGRGIAVKASLVGVAVVPQLFLRNRRDMRKIFTIANFVDAGFLTGVGAHNMGIQPVR